MARPIKNSCDYFTHDAGMRDHKKVKSIRQKFGITGYAIWCMLLELLTGSDGNVFEDSEIELELISGDFGVSVTEIRQVIDYCYKLEMLFLNNGFVSSESLDERLKSVYEKRGRLKQKSEKQLRIDGKFSRNTESDGVSVTDTPSDTVVTATEKPQIKLNKIILNNINIEFDVFWDLYDKKVGDKSKLKKKWEALTDEERQKAIIHIPLYKKAKTDKQFRKDPQTYLNNKSFNDEIIGIKGEIMQQKELEPEKEWWERVYGHIYKTKKEFEEAYLKGEVE